MLNRNAYVAATDFRHRFADRRFEFTGSIDASRVSGTPAAMLATQTDAVHYFQQPDGHLPLDSARTSLSGDAEQLTFGKVGGGITRFQTSFNRMSPGFEPNDLGYLQRADLQNWSNWFSLNFNTPALFFNSAFFNFNRVELLEQRRAAHRARGEHELALHSARQLRDRSGSDGVAAARHVQRSRLARRARRCGTRPS